MFNPVTLFFFFVIFAAVFIVCTNPAKTWFFTFCYEAWCNMLSDALKATFTATIDAGFTR